MTPHFARLKLVSRWFAGAPDVLPVVFLFPFATMPGVWCLARRFGGGGGITYKNKKKFNNNKDRVFVRY